MSEDNKEKDTHLKPLKAKPGGKTDGTERIVAAIAEKKEDTE